MTRRSRILTALLLLLALAGLAALVGQRLTARQEAQKQAAASARVPAEFVLSADDVAAARDLPLVRGIAVSGGLKAADTALVKAKVAAELKTLLVREGDAVKRGQLLGELDPEEFELRLRQAERNRDAAQAQLDIAGRNLENSRALVRQGFISDTALATAQANESAARATLQAAQAAVDLALKSRADARLIAPLDGLVSQRLAQPGERVALDGRVLEIVSLQRLELEATLTPSEAAELRVGQAARLKVDGLSAPVAARVARINPSVQAGSRAVTAYLALQPTPDAAAALRQGLYATGRIETGRRTALLVPLSALRREGERASVRVLEGGRIVARAVRTGLEGEAAFGPGDAVEPAIEVVDGLREGETVLRTSVGAARDGQAARLATPSTPAPSAPAATPANAASR